MMRLIYVFCLVLMLAGCQGGADEVREILDAQVSDVGRLAEAGPPDVRAQIDQGVADAARDAAVDARVLDSGRADLEVDAEPGPLPDLVLLEDELGEDIWLDAKFVSEESCEFVEQCVGGTGRRLLLRFSVATANIGETDLVLGRPQDNADLFSYSECHEHYHFETYAAYELRSAAGTQEPDAQTEPVARGHKQAFCLMDTHRYFTDDPTVPENARYGCTYQGISRGWKDTYGSHLDCQWIDVTDLEPGTYELVVQINQDRVLRESRHDNNAGRVSVVVPVDDIQSECAEGVRSGVRRSCGWRLREEVRCRAGDLVEIGCGGCGEFGQPCEGNPMLRICDGEGRQCYPSTALADNDDGCGDSQCPHLEFMCPESRRFTIWEADSVAGESSRCDYAVRSGPPELTRACLQSAPRGLERLCGWQRALDDVECRPGFRYRVGCTGGMEECSIGPRCEGDPMLRVCEGQAACLSAQSLAQADDGCGTQCPAVEFQCPLRGRVSVFTASYRDDRRSVCEAELRIIE